MAKKSLTATQIVELGLARAQIQEFSGEVKKRLAVELILGAIEPGYDPLRPREGLEETPARVVSMWEEIFAGYNESPAKILETTFTEDNHQEMILVKDIPFFSHCEHHMATFHGKIHIAYIPKNKIVGISKLARLADCFAKRLQIQERLTSQIADTLQEVLDPIGVAVIVQAEHMCMTMRGVRKPGAKTVTSAMRGVFRETNNDARLELMTLID